MNDCRWVSHRKGQTPNWTTANLSAESLTLRYRISKRSNSNDSLQGALVTPVISKSMATKSASLTWRRRSLRDDSKFDLVTFLRANEEEEEQKQREIEGRFRVCRNPLNTQCFFIGFSLQISWLCLQYLEEEEEEEERCLQAFFNI